MSAGGREGQDTAPARGPKDDLWLASARKLTHTMDERHLDPILGFFFPFVGDFVGGVLGAYLMVLAWRRGKSKVVLARMALNTAIDTAVGAVPLVGDLFDHFFRANSRNLRLLERADSGGNSAWDSLWLGLSLVALVMALLLPVALVVAFGFWAWHRFG